jgi:hypothetical protein
VPLFVDEVFVDRFRTFGAPDWIDDEVVAEILEPNDVRYHALGDANFFLEPNAPGKGDDTILHMHVDIIGIEHELLLERVAHERPKLVVAEIVEISDVLVILFHASSGPPRGRFRLPEEQQRCAESQCPIALPE